MLEPNQFLEFLQSTRDVRGYDFLDKPIENEKLQMILKAAISAPSVGYSQPWKFVIIEDKKIKKDIYNNFKIENEKAKKIF